jgi:opacity protein-like surface antigen
MLLSSAAVTAAQPGDQSTVINRGIYASISGGLDFIRTNGNQRLILLDSIPEYYTGHQAYKTSGSVGFGFGLEREFRSNLSWQIGLAGYFNSAVKASGHRWEFGLPDFDNFTYKYQVKSSRAVVTGKLLGTYQEHYHPYMSGELGASFNRASGYSEKPLLDEEFPMEPFSAHTQTSFSWGLGLGVDRDICTVLRLGIGYQFVDLGRASLGRSPVQETHNTLSIPHLYDHQVRVQLTALI